MLTLKKIKIAFILLILIGITGCKPDTVTIDYLVKQTGLTPAVLQAGIEAYIKARKAHVVHSPIVTFIDYSKPSSEKRLWILNLKSKRLLFHDYVAHGQGNGYRDATRFSNVEDSHASSLGFFVTGSTYHGQNGLSLKLKGLEPGFNDNAFSRHIVFHGAPYVSQRFIREHGYAGRSWGCPAVDDHISDAVIETIAGGSFVMMYYPDPKWLANSDYLS